MIRRDYLLRMIEEFARALARLRRRKEAGDWSGAGQMIEEELRGLFGGTRECLLQFSESELLARLLAGEPTASVRDRTLALAALLKEAGDIAVAEERPQEARIFHLKGLNLLLHALAVNDPAELPEFAPTIELFRTALGEEGLPTRTEALLMMHYERLGAWSLAEDSLFRLAAADPDNDAVYDLGAEFYARLRGKDDETLVRGDLPRGELEEGFAELQRTLRRPG